MKMGREAAAVVVAAGAAAFAREEDHLGLGDCTEDGDSLTENMHGVHPLEAS